jgi:hypothetical protein
MGADSVLDMAVQLAAEGNSSDAEALVRFALSTDPDASHAHVCLARIRATRGEFDAAVDGLVDAVRVRAAAGVDDPTPLYEMLAAALELVPARLDLHIDLAELQAAHGDVPGAQARLVQLSAIYVDAGRHDDARDVLAVASGWDPQGSVAGVIVDSIPVEESVEILLEEVEEAPLPQPAPTPRRRVKSATVCTPTLLRDAGGDVLPNQDIVPAPAIRRRRAPRAATICTPTLLRDAQGHLLPNQQSIPKPAPERGRPSRRPERIPAPPTQAQAGKKRPSTGRSRTVPTSRTSIRTLRARVRVRHEPEINQDAPLASRLRRLGNLPSK